MGSIANWLDDTFYPATKRSFLKARDDGSFVLKQRGYLWQGYHKVSKEFSSLIGVEDNRYDLSKIFSSQDAQFLSDTKGVIRSLQPGDVQYYCKALQGLPPLLRHSFQNEIFNSFDTHVEPSECKDPLEELQNLKPSVIKQNFVKSRTYEFISHLLENQMISDDDSSWVDLSKVYSQRVSQLEDHFYEDRPVGHIRRQLYAEIKEKSYKEIPLSNAEIGFISYCERASIGPDRAYRKRPKSEVDNNLRRLFIGNKEEKSVLEAEDFRTLQLKTHLSDTFFEIFPDDFSFKMKMDAIRSIPNDSSRLATDAKFHQVIKELWLGFSGTTLNKYMTFNRDCVQPGSLENQEIVDAITTFIIKHPQKAFYQNLALFCRISNFSDKIEDILFLLNFIHSLNCPSQITAILLKIDDNGFKITDLKRFIDNASSLLKQKPLEGPFDDIDFRRILDIDRFWFSYISPSFFDIFAEDDSVNEKLDTIESIVKIKSANEIFKNRMCHAIIKKLWTALKPTGFPLSFIESQQFLNNPIRFVYLENDTFNDAIISFVITQKNLSTFNEYFSLFSQLASFELKDSTEWEILFACIKELSLLGNDSYTTTIENGDNHSTLYKKFKGSYNTAMSDLFALCNALPTDTKMKILCAILKGYSLDERNRLDIFINMLEKILWSIQLHASKQNPNGIPVAAGHFFQENLHHFIKILNFLLDKYVPYPSTNLATEIVGFVRSTFQKESIDEAMISEFLDHLPEKGKVFKKEKAVYLYIP